MKTIVTTAGRPDERSLKLAEEAAKELGYTFVPRKKRSVMRLQKEYQCSVMIAGHERFELYRPNMEKPFFFHPNSAMFRLKRLLKGETDPLIEVAALEEGDTFLDCTLGLASDSLIAAFAVGATGKVLGLEKDADVAFIVKEGLKNFPTTVIELEEVMARIHVAQADAVTYLSGLADDTWDVVYIDPMFTAAIEASSNFTPLREVGAGGALTKKWVDEAFRVAKRRVVIKDYFNSPMFEAFNFKQIIRPNTKFHFGYLEKKGAVH